MEKFIKFGFVGIINTGLNFLVYNILLFFGVDFIVANTIGFGVGMINSFIWNNYWVFKTKSKSPKIMIKFITVNLILLGLANVLLFIFVKEFGIEERIAQVLVVIINMLINFVASKFWTFKEKRD